MYHPPISKNWPSVRIGFLFLTLCFPILSPLNAGDMEAQPVSFQPPVPVFSPPSSHQLIPCPDLYEVGAESQTICAMSGVVDYIQLGRNDRIAWIIVSITGQDFLYFPKGGDTGTPLGLFTASKINRIPVSLRFQNWGGRYYITEANF